MNRRQLTFVIVLNALVSLVIALTVVWAVEARRPDPEELAAIYTPVATPPIAATFTPTGQQSGAMAQTEAATPGPTPVTEDSIYVVQAGDSLSGIAQRFGVAVTDLVEVNKLTNPDFVFAGQRLVIPKPGEVATAPTATATHIPTTNAKIRVSAIGNGGDLANESVSIVNDSDLAVNLQGWQLRKDDGVVYTFGNVLLFPGSGVILYTGTGTNTSVALYWNQPAPLWQTGAVAKLVNAEGVEVSQLVAP